MTDQSWSRITKLSPCFVHPSPAPHYLLGTIHEHIWDISTWSKDCTPTWYYRANSFCFNLKHPEWQNRNGSKYFHCSSLHLHSVVLRFGWLTSMRTHPVLHIPQFEIVVLVKSLCPESISFYLCKTHWFGSYNREYKRWYWNQFGGSSRTHKDCNAASHKTNMLNSELKNRL